ncbi:MAG: hypothetical protein WD847_09730 [Pirellulales bacterium]
MAVEDRRTPLRPARRFTLVAWIAGLASLGLTGFQACRHAFHPHYLPLGLLYAALAVATLGALLCCLWRLLRGPRRVVALALAVVAIVPAALWAAIGLTAKVNAEHRRIPDTIVMRLAKVMGATIMRAEMDLKYPHRVESERILMFYDDLDRPDEDLAAMDEHVARLETLLGGTVSSKVYWIRGPLVGGQYLSVHGLSIGSSNSPERPGEYRGDRHELAHAALDWFRAPHTHPPQVLHEGWAMSQCGDSAFELALDAMNARQEDPSISVRKLFGPEWYDKGTGPVYTVGGAFVDFLLRTRGAPRFLRFYTECQPDTFEYQCREIFAINFDELETEFWANVQNTLQTKNTTK